MSRPSSNSADGPRIDRARSSICRTVIVSARASTEITSETGYKPVAFVAIDNTWTALRFKRV